MRLTFTPAFAGKANPCVCLSVSPKTSFFSPFCAIIIASIWLCSTSGLFAQVNIIDPNAANTPDISKCFSETTLEASLQFTTNGTNAIVSIPMPTGVEYVPGSVALVSQTGGLSIVQTSGAVANPTFTVSASDGMINASDEIRFSFRVKAYCTAMAGTAIFPVNVTFANQTTSGEISADIIQADLNLLSHPIQMASIGTPVTVPIQVQNGGLGSTDNVVFIITESGMTTTAVTVGGFPAMLISTVGTVKTYQIPVAAFSGGSFDNPETITVLRTVVLQSCTFSSSYGVNWGCSMAQCQSPTPTAPGEFVLATGNPNLVATSMIISSSNLCSNTIIDITYTNNGTGAVSAAAAFNNVFRFGMGSATTWTSSNWMTNGITLNGNAVTHTTGMSGTPASVDASQFTSDPDGAGGLTDLDGDGSFDELPQGQSVTFRVALKYTCPTACPAPDDVANLIAGATYNNQCGTASSSTAPTAFTFNNTAIGTPEIFYPSTVTGGQKFNVQICIARNFQGATCANNTFQLNLTLPPGIMATGVGSYNGTPATVTTAGGVATVSGTFASGTTCFVMEMMYTCPSSPLSFSYEALYTCNTGCACVQRWGCGTFDIVSGGCGVCANGGLTVNGLTIQRQTLGFTDRTGATTVNPATLSMNSLRKGMPCDEFLFTVTGTMNGGTGGTAMFNNGYLEISYDQLAGANLLQYVSGTFNYFDASTGITTNNITLPTPTSSVIGGRHVLIFNFNAFIATLPGGTMAINDMVTAAPLLRVLNNAGLTATPMRPGNARATFFNLASSAGNPLPGGDARFTCDYYVPEFYLHNPMVIPNAVSGARMGCGTYQVAGTINHELTVQADEYPNEVRPLFRLTSIVVQITNGDAYNAAVTPTLIVYGSADDPAYPVTFNLPAPTITGGGTILTWTNTGTWPLHDLAGTSQSSTGYQLRFNLTNSGCANAADAVFKTTWNYSRFGYAPVACRVATSSGALSGTVAGGAPVHTLTNQTGTVYANGRTACFQVKIENTTVGSESRYVWLAMEDNLSPMDVVSVRDLSTNTLLPLLSYVNGKWVKVTTSLPGGTSRTLEICVTYNNCSNNAMTIRQGWDCSAYPVNPASTTCNANTIINTTLNIQPRPAAVQGDFIATSPLPATICNDFTFDVRINSSQQGDLVNPRVKITLPAGMTVQGNVQIEYPLNSNNWQNATPVITGQMILVNLINHTGIDDTLPGTLSANPTNFPAGQDRQARVRVTVRTTCDFFAGDRILYQPFGEAPCGAAAMGSGTEFKSPRIRIAGADPTYEGTFKINLGTGSALNGCFTRTISTVVQLADINTTDGMAASTGQADTITLSLPSVLDYVPNSYVCTTVPAAYCPTFISATILPNGRRLLKFALPPNIPIPNGGVVPIAFNFKVQPQQSIACTVEDVITGKVIAVYTGIYCTTSGMNCPKITALAGEGEAPVILKKRQFTFENPAFTCNSMGEFNYNLPVRLQNLPLEADSTIRVEIFCLDANGNITGGPVQLLTLTGPLAVGSLTTFTGTFGACDAQNGVRAIIPLTTSAGAFQCHCAAVSTDYRNLNKCPTVTVAANDIEICPNETVTVTATVINALSGGVGTWTTNGNGTFASATAISTVYTPGTTDKTAGVVTLTYTYDVASDACPAVSNSILITIRPLPTVAAATLTVCATTLGGTTGSFTLTNADNLVDPADVNTVTYHATQANANTGISPLSSPYSAINNAVVYARVRTAFGCYATSIVTLKVNALPTAANTSLSVCENDPAGSGIGTFNLNNATTTVNSTAGNTITYYASLADAQTGINSLTSPFLATNGTLIYARVFNATTGCYNTSVVTLNVVAKPRAYSGQLQLCPDAFDGSTATFTLSNANVQVTAGVAGLTVSYYFSLTNAQQGVNPLPNMYVSQTADVWVRVQNTAGCFQVDQVQLVVLENPEIEATGINISCFGGSNGTATVKVLGGFQPYTYDWSNDGPETPDNDPPTITGLAAGTYVITVTDGNGCTSIDNITLTQPTNPLTATVGSIINVACRGSATGAIELTVSGGTAPYQYNWPAPVPDVEDPNGVPAGTYVVTVTDSKGCTATASATVTQPATVLAATTMVNSNALCTGGNTGSATVTASGGTSPYAYLWSNGQTVATATNLSAGSYTVTVTDAVGCTKIATATITNPSGLLVVIGSSTNVSCSGGNNGRATAAATGGTSPYSFSWSNGQTGSMATNLTAGNYTVTVTDASGCTAQTSVTITQPTQLILNVAYVANVTCNGASNGYANVIATGGTPAYTYMWPGGFTGHIRSNLAPNTYIVTVTDVNTCSATTTVTITQPLVLSASVTSTTPVSCFGGNNGAIDLTVVGGTSPFSFNWSGTAPDIEDPVNLAAGVYTVLVTDQNGCTTTAMATVTQPVAPLTATISNVMNTACNGASTGSATVNPAGGTPAYSIFWSNGQTTATVTGLAAGSYTVTVTDSKGCTALAAVTIIHPVLLSVGITTINNVACNGMPTGSATALANGGTSPYAYKWSTAPMQTTATAINLAAGTYTVTATDQNTCTATTTVTITQPTLLVASIVNTKPVSCTGGTDGTATATATGGTTPYTYSWPGGTTGPVMTGLATGSYVVTVTDANGCMAFATAMIGQPATTIAISINSITNILCNGAATGAINITVTGGSAPYSYNWSGSTPDIEDPFGLAAGTYNLTVTDLNGCTAITNVTISQPATAVSATISNTTNASCTGVGSGSATVAPAGGTPGYSYLWSNGQTSQTASGLSAGAYQVTVTDINGCTAVATAVISNPANLTIAVRSIMSVRCSGELSGGATVLASGGTPIYNYLWSDNTAGPVLSGVGVGLYSVTVTDANSCTAQTSVNIPQPTPVVASIQSTTRPTCNGVDNGTATATATGGVGPYTYRWSSGATMATATGLAPGTYTVTVTDANACTATVTATVPAAPPALVVVLTSQVNISCFGGNNGSINITVSGGSGPYKYDWNNPAPDVEDPAGLVAGTYTVTITDVSGCTATTSTTITQPATALSSSITAFTNPLCNGNANGSATVTAAGGSMGYTYAWSNGETTATVTDLAAGSYQVTVRDVNGCSSVSIINLVNPATVTAVISSKTDVSCNSGMNGAVTVLAAGGTNTFTYNWQNAGGTAVGNTATITGLSAGIYRVTATDANGCTAATTVTINQPVLLLAWIINTTPVLCVGDMNGSALAAATGGVTPYSFAWPGMGMDALRTGLAAGNYIVTVTDANGCTATQTATITGPPVALTVSVLSITNVLCYGKASGAIDVMANGGTAPYTYAWNNGAPDIDDPSGLLAGTYIVTVTDLKGCTATTSATITQPVSPVSAVTSVVTQATCMGIQTGEASVTATGGTAPYTYMWDNGQSTQNATGLGAGSYAVTVTDANGCTTVGFVNITNPVGLTAIISNQTNVSCDGGNDGTATVTVNGGTPPYTYNWSGGTTGTTTRMGLAAETFTVTVTDNNGCTVQTSVTLSQPPPLSLIVLTTQPAACAGATNGAGWVLAEGGTPGYSYVWPGGLTGANQNNLAAGNYEVTATDSKGCTATTTVTIGSNGALTVQPLPDIGPICPAGTVPSILLSATPFDPNIVFVWSGGAAAGLSDGNSTGFNAHIPAFTASSAEGIYPITITATLQGCTTIVNFNITIDDVTPPSFIDCPLGMVMEGNDPDQCSAKVNFAQPAAVDECSPNVTVIQTTGPISGSVFPIGTQQIVFTANDGNGNTRTCAFSVVVIDTENPELTCPTQFLSVPADGNCAYTVSNTAFNPRNVMDNCSVASLTHDYAAAPSNATLTGATFNAGTTNVTWTVTDGSGHTVTCAYSVIVEDETPPTVTIGTCPTDIIANSDDTDCGAIITYTAPVFQDNCDGLLLSGTLSAGFVSGSNFPIGTTPVQYSYTDLAGNGPTICTFNVTVNDVEFPIIQCPANTTVETDGTVVGGALTPVGIGPCGVTLAYTAPIGTDNCTGTETDLISGFGAGANYYVYGGIYTHIWRATDASGNTTTCQFTITLEDPIAPFITCPANTTVNVDPGECDASVTYSLPLADDNCPNYVVNLIQGPASGAEFAIGTTTVEYEIFDDMGNGTACDFTVTVIDHEKPQITTCPPSRTINTSTGALNDCQGVVPNMLADMVAIDNCTTAIVIAASATQNPVANATFGTTNGSTQVVTFTVTDAAGNTQTCSTTLTLIDNELPTINCAPIVRTVNANANCNYQTAAGEFNPTLTDNCAVTLTHNYAPGPQSHTLAGAIFPIGNSVVTFTATDANNNTATCNITVQVVDTQNPVFVSCPLDITVGNNVDKCGANVVFTRPNANDNCSATVTQTAGLLSGALFPVGTTLVTFSAVDPAGNPATCTFNITVLDMQMPKAICTDFMVNLSSVGAATITAANINGGSSDNCTVNPVLTASKTTFDCSNVGLNYVTLAVMDAAGNINNCVSTVTVKDVTPPVITCPANVVLNSCSSPVPDVASSTTAMDACGIATITQNPAAGVLLGNSLNITLTATDINGNTSTCAITVSVNDNVPPVLLGCPANTTISADPSECDAAVIYSIPTASDNCPGVIITRTSGFISGEEFPVGTTTVTYLATDVTGNTVSCTFNVTVTDNEKPLITTCPPARTINTSTGILTDCQGVVPNMLLEVISTDNCTSAAALSTSAVQNPVAGTAFGTVNGSTQVVTFTVTDAANNTQTCTTTLTLVDDQVPTINCAPVLRTVNTSTNCTYQTTAGEFNPTFADNCLATLTHNYAAGPQSGTLAGAIFPIGNTLVNFTATDANNNTATCNITVQVLDNQNPVFVNCPANITVGNDVDKCGSNVTFATPIATDNCGATVTQTAGLLSGSLFPVGTTPITFGAVDAAGNPATCTFNIIVMDMQRPHAICTDFSVNLNAAGSATITPTNINAGSTDNCTANPTLVASQTAFTCTNVGLNYITLRVTDAAGNVDSCASTVTVHDVTAPVITCPANVTLASCSSPVPNVASSTTATDACGVATITQNPAAGVLIGQNQGNGLTITLTATDVNGNTSTCIVTVSINDNVAPTLLGCPANTTVSADPGECDAAVTYSIPTASDNCPGVVVTRTTGFISGEEFPVGTTTVTYLATDVAGNTVSCTFNVTVTDNEKPLITTCPPARTINTSAGLLNDCQGLVPNMLAEVVATDNCTSVALLSASATQNPLAGTAFGTANGSTQVVTFTVTDAAGNNQTCSTTLTLVDDQVPTINCAPLVRTVTSNANCSYQVAAGEFDPTFADNCTATLTHNYAPGPQSGTLAGAIFPVGSTVVNFTVTDANSNTATCSVTVRVLDNQNPSFINCPANITVNNSPAECGAYIIFTAPGSNDNCGAIVTQTAGPVSGSLFLLGTTAVTFSATDTSGNPVICTFTVTVNDNEKPVITTCPAARTVLTSTGSLNDCQGLVPNMLAEIIAADNCASAAVLSASAVQNPLAGTNFGTAHGSTQVVTFTVTDAAGNTQTCSTTLTLVDDQAPTINCAPIIRTVNSNANCSYQVTAGEFNPVIADNCMATLTHNYAPGPQSNTLAGAIFPIGNTLVTFTATDANNNTATCALTVQVLDNQNPVFVNCPANITVGNDVDKCGSNVTFATPIASDNCGATVTQTAGLLSGALFPVGTTPVTFGALDAAGNPATCAFNVIVMDMQRPHAICTDFTVNLNSVGAATITPNNINGGSNDNCTVSPTLAASQTSFSCANIGLNSTTLTVTDAAGNVNTCVSTVTVQDVTPPVINCPANVTLSSCSSPVPNVVSSTTATDACGATIITQNPPAGVLFGQNQSNGLSITLTATDAHGNTSTCVVTVTVNDNVPPILLGCPANTTVSADPGECDAAVTYSIPTASDNCPGVVVTRTTGFASGEEFPVGTTTVTYLATDAAGNTASCTFTVTVTDNEKPLITTCPPNRIIYTTTSQGIVPNLVPEVIATDNCTGTAALSASAVQSPAAGTLFGSANGSEQIVIITVTDAAGNTQTCTVTLRLADAQVPGINCGAATRTVNASPNTCGYQVAANEFDATFTDNLGGAILTHNYAPAPQSNTLTGAIFPVGSTTVIFTVTDANNNTATCSVVIVVIDNQNPVFLDCPTTTIIVGNDVDKCSAKVNWPIPVASDNCGVLAVVQTSGPGNGATVNVSPTPFTVIYKATDIYGHTSTCSFQVQVADLQNPQFDADILMPGNITVTCTSIPPPFVGHNPVQGPLTNDDVHDNCTAPQNLVIQFSEVSTQSLNPASCAASTYTITRTWRVIDAAGNVLTHVQIITVQDTQAPNALCKNIVVTLDGNGVATITPADINNGSTDNCAASANLNYSISTSIFTCSNLGPNTVTLTVTDPCGNVSTCTSTVTVNAGVAPCVAAATVATSCMDNATTPDNGQFVDLITIKALAGQIWKITANTGLYNTNSAAPPAGATLLQIGDLFTPGTADGINNDGDGQTDEADEAIFYTLRGLHIDCQGYNISVSNAGGLGAAATATTTVIQNRACYPTPFFLNIDNQFCLSTPPFPIQMNAGNGAQGTVSNIMIDGVAATIFNAAQLGVGTHTISAVFDAGTATTDLVINGVQIHGSPQAALQDPGCRQAVSTTVQIVGTSSQLACDDLVHVSLDEDCTVTLTAADVIQGNYFCYDDYSVELDKILPFGNGPWVLPILTASDIGKTYYYHVVHAIGGNVCWGQVLIEDKLVPKLVCPANITVVCSQSTDPAFTGNITITDCSATTTVIDDDFDDLGNCHNPRGIITRTWIVTDAIGNQSTCSQKITITPFHFADLIFPGDVTLNCATTYGNAEALLPINTGRPSISGVEIGNGGLCTVSIGYDDQYLNICVGNYEIIRTWIVRDACLPLSATNPVEYKQLIKVIDNGPPVFNCPANITVSTNNDNCCATVDLPDVIITEGCSNIKNLKAKVSGTNPANGNIITFTVNGTLGNFPGNNPWLPDTLAVFGLTQCLPIGVYDIQYTAEDECGNAAVCNFKIRVADQTPPAVSCQQSTKTALGGNGKSVLDAAVFNAGTTDNCCLDHFEVRRMTNGCSAGTNFGATVTFCCADIGDSLLVVFRAFDCNGNTNDCMVRILVEDKLPPSCIPPANVTVSCESFDPTLWNYGQATVVDNCCVGATQTTNNYAQFDTICNRGTIIRTFHASDCNGQTAQCTQQIVVDYHQDYYIKFPDDKIVTSCNGTGNYGEPVFFGKDCELLGVSYVDEIFTVVEDACYKIERTWSIINWCTYNPNLPKISVPNPNPSTISNDASNLPGPIVSAPNATAPWAPTVVKINPTDVLATNYTSFWTANANGYIYKQIIKIIDGQPPVAINCPDSLVTFCDSTANNSQLWHDTYYYDPVTQSHDLCEGPTDLTITAFDSCSLSAVNIRYLLWLDLNNDGTPETVINSNQLPAPNVLPFGNAANPNFSGGTPYAFDQRPVPIDQQYAFALQTAVVGLRKVAHVAWNTQSAPGTYLVPELPYGTHKIEWIISDGCGNESICKYNFVVKDCKAPTVACLNGLAINIMPTQMIQLWASDFLQYVEDNCTPSNQLKLAIRRAGQGQGFPVDAQGNPQTNVIFNCDDLGTQEVELWALDQAGNAGYCTTYVIIQDNNHNCPEPGTATIAGALETEDHDGVEAAEVELTGINLQTKTTNNTGNYAFNGVPFNTDATVTPVKDDNPLNGVTTYDLVLISRHILGLEPLNSPYKMIAADANRSGSITAFDIIELRKLILGIYQELPNNTSWRFVDQAFTFPNITNPFQTLFPENKSYATLSVAQLNQDFVGVKIGDVNGSVLSNSLVQVDDRATNTLLINVEDRLVKVGEECLVQFQAAELAAGFQFTLLLNGLQVMEIVPQGKVTAENFGIFEAKDLMTVSIAGEQTFTVRFRATKAGKLSQLLHLSSQITTAEAYNSQGQRQEVALRFQQGSSSIVAGVGFELYQNEPNPFVEQTTIRFHLPAASAATLTIWDEQGRTLLTQRGDFAKGYNSIVIGQELSSKTGVLYYKLEIATASAIRKMVQVK